MEGGKIYDTVVERTLRATVGGALDTIVFKELQFPTKPTVAEVPTLGLGLKSAVTIAPSAFLASAAMPSSSLCLVTAVRLHPLHTKVRRAHITHVLINVKSTPHFRSLLSMPNVRRNNIYLRHSFIRPLRAKYRKSLIG